MTNPAERDRNEPSGANGREPPIAVAKERGTRAPAEAPELLRADAGALHATTVHMDRSGAEQIVAERVMMDRSGAKSIAAKSAQLDRSGVLMLKADHVVLHGGSATAVDAHEARLVRGKVLLLRSATTTVEGELKTLIYIGQASDNVKPLLNAQGALRFGAAFGATLLLGGRLLRRLFGDR